MPIICKLLHEVLRGFESVIVKSQRHLSLPTAMAGVLIIRLLPIGQKRITFTRACLHESNPLILSASQSKVKYQYYSYAGTPTLVPNTYIDLIQSKQNEWLQWHNNEHGGGLKSTASRVFAKPFFFQTQIKENIKALRHWLREGNSPMTGEFSGQRASNTENISIS